MWKCRDCNRKFSNATIKRVDWAYLNKFVDTPSKKDFEVECCPFCGSAFIHKERSYSFMTGRANTYSNVQNMI